MRKNLFYTAILALGMMYSFAACSDDDPTPTPDNGGDEDSTELLYNSENASSWGNYMYNVANLLKNDATTLYDAWNDSYEGGASYASLFKEHNNSTYGSAINCIQEIVEGCITIAGEVGDAKIGDPYNLYMQGNTTQALYAVESWYSWHSRDDYTNNIYSIRNAYYGSLDGSVNEHSIAALIASTDADRDTAMKAAIKNAADAIQAIPQPFRNNINSDEAVAAMEACSDLEAALDDLSRYVQATFSADSYDAILDAIVDNYVDAVVLPTYKALKDENTALYNAVVAFRDAPTDASFSAACDAWLTAREPWEKSEAFLFGPVDALGLDPNMDSWPLDQDGIVQILNSGNYDELNWTDGDTEDAIEAAQSVRGYHTLEYLLFMNGEPRKVNN